MDGRRDSASLEEITKHNESIADTTMRLLEFFEGKITKEQLEEMSTDELTSLIAAKEKIIATKEEQLAKLHAEEESKRNKSLNSMNNQKYK